MTRAEPGELVFSYASGCIRAIGYVASKARSAKRPSEFGRAGKAWSKHEGWKVPVRFTRLVKPFKPAMHMRQLRALLPPKHSPIRSNGKGNQGVYLAEIPHTLADALKELMKESPQASSGSNRDSVAQREREETASVERIQRDKDLDQTEKRRLIAARIGQGLFRQKVEALEAACRVTGITDRRFLRASHIRPWCRSNNRERLDGNNGLLLAAHIDHLFDGGYISFEDDGTLIVSKVCPSEILLALGVFTPLNVGPFRPAQQSFLRYHRQSVFRGGVRRHRGLTRKSSGRRH